MEKGAEYVGDIDGGGRVGRVRQRQHFEGGIAFCGTTARALNDLVRVEMTGRNAMPRVARGRELLERSNEKSRRI